MTEVTARVGNDGVPVLRTPNLAEPTPRDEFSKRVRAAIAVYESRPWWYKLLQFRLQ